MPYDADEDPDGRLLAAIRARCAPADVPRAEALACLVELAAISRTTREGEPIPLSRLVDDVRELGGGRLAVTPDEALAAVRSSPCLSVDGDRCLLK